MKIIKSKFGTTLAALSVGAALTVAPAASAAPVAVPTVTTGAIFNNPTGVAAGTPQDTPNDPVRLAETRIKRHLLDLVNGAAEGSSIQISVYLDWDGDVTKALVAAHKRGVNVQVIAGDDRYSAVAGLKTELVKPGAPNSWFRACRTTVQPDATVVHDACLAKDATAPRDNVNHQKFFLFSRTKGNGDEYVDNVVVQSSGNLTEADYTRWWNDALTVVGNSALFGAYQTYFEAQAAAAAGGPQTSNYATDTAAGKAKVYFFPKSGDDTIVNVLKTVIPAGTQTPCAGNTSVGTKDGRTKIRIAQGHTTRPEVAKQLWELAQAGCHIEVVYRSLENWDAAGNPYSQVSPWLTRPTTGKGRIILHDLGNDERDGTDTHTKYLLIEGTYYNGPDKKIVFTGSHTYTENALRYNDEALLKYEDPAVFAAYLQNFEDQRAASLAEREL
ncbi:phosphatidylserine/phosphatidylglycerophosphate/cardiolipin synthase family protein [Streptomyces sp. NPDC056362]|uniref:phospholipase D-like domain-containing protein n=1 Tax=unclassified Streptomyces TaxID=2593676 RepID=UPI0035DF3FB3